MSTSTELRRIVGAMTERPWVVEREREGWISVFREHGTMVFRGERDPRFAPDATGITTLANHADALVVLVEACERYVRGIDPEVFSTRAEANLHYALADALAAVHAVKETP